MKNKLRKTMALLVSAAMVISTSSVLPYSNFYLAGIITASAEEGISLPTTLQFGNINIIEKGAITNASGDTWNYDASTNTINITADTTVSRYVKCIYSDGDLNINVAKNVTLNATVTGSNTNYGSIRCEGDMFISGAGTVNAVSDASHYAYNKASVHSGGKMHILGVTLNLDCTSAYNTYLIDAGKGLIIEDAIVTSTYTCKSGSTDEPCPIEILGNSIVNINSSEYGLRGSEFTFSDSAHVKIETKKPYVIGDFNYTPEKLFLTNNHTNNYYWRTGNSASFKDGKTSSCADANTNYYFEYIGANHLHYTSNNDGETHKYCDCINSTDEKCSGGTATCTDKATCDDCNSEYGTTIPHSPKKTESKVPTCAEVGNTEYWQCSECGKYFSDEACTNEITLAQTVINATNHPNAKKTEKVEPTCTEDGNIEYWYCPDCDKYFSDEACTSEIYINTQFSVSGNMNFDYNESSGNWKTDAALENDGYAWNEDTKTLTLGNIYINGDLILPYDGGLNTIVIADGTTPIVSGNITFSPYQTSLTVKGNGTLTAGFDNGNVGSDNVLTITGGAEVITDFMMWSTNGGIAISDGGKLNVSEYIFTEKIIMDDTAVFEKDINVGIGNYGNVENGFAGLEKYIPLGYKLEQIGSVYVIPNDTTLVLDEENWSYDVLDKDGNLITGRVTMRYNPYSDGIGEHLAGHSISLDGNIGVNFYMELDESIVEDSGAYMQFTLPNNKESKVYVKDAKTDTIDGKEYHIFSCSVAAKEMFDIITAQIISGDRKGTVYEYSVADYADYIIENANDYDKNTISLVRAMKDYGEYAKSYFGKEETTDISDITAENLTEFEKKTEGTLLEGIEYYGSSLLLESETTVRHYFKVKNSKTINEDDFTGQKDGYYYTDISNIPAGQLGTLQKTTIDGWSISYSPMSYVYTVLTSDSADENLKNLCKALYLYQQAAAEYQNKGGNSDERNLHGTPNGSNRV